jgi:hypothetical protein
VLDGYFISDAIRARRLEADRLRRAATDDTAETWELLARAARLDRDADVVEAEHDAILAGGRIA